MSGWGHWNRSITAIFVWPWNENALTKQKLQMNGNRAILLVYRTDTDTPGFWNFMPENFLENQRILRFDVILQQDWLIEQCPQQIRFFWRKNEEAMFWSFHPVADKTNNEHLRSARNHFSRSYENRFILSKFALNLLLIFKRQTSTTVFFFMRGWSAFKPIGLSAELLL